MFDVGFSERRVTVPMCLCAKWHKDRNIGCSAFPPTSDVGVHVGCSMFHCFGFSARINFFKNSVFYRVLACRKVKQGETERLKIAADRSVSETGWQEGHWQSAKTCCASVPRS